MSESNIPVEGHFLLQLNKTLSRHCDHSVVQDHKRYLRDYGPDHPTTKAMAAQVAEGGKAAAAEMVNLINEAAQSGVPMVPMTSMDFKTIAIDEAMTNDEAKELRQKRALKLLEDGPMSKKDLGNTLGIEGQAFSGAMDPLVESKQVTKVGDDFALPETSTATT